MSWKVIKNIEDVETIKTQENTEDAMEMVHTVYIEIVFRQKTFPNEETGRIYHAIEEVIADRKGLKQLQSAEDFLNGRKRKNH